jgi:hypothetical protein
MIREMVKLKDTVHTAGMLCGSVGEPRVSRSKQVVAGAHDHHQHHLLADMAPDAVRAGAGGVAPDLDSVHVARGAQDCEGLR